VERAGEYVILTNKLMDNTHTTVVFVSLVGFLFGLVVAEVAYKRASKHAAHVVPATIVNNHKKVVNQKLFYYGFFLTILFAEYVLHIKIPEPVYWLDGFAIAGGDVQKLANKFFRLK
jgi:hypothetical protein